MGARHTSPILVGRDDHLAALRSAVAASADGVPRFVIVRGEAGIGKSRLVREALADLPPDTRTLVGECLDIGAAGLPYLPLVEALRRLARTTDPASLDAFLGGGRTDLAVLVPELAAAADGDAGATAPSPTLAMSGIAQARLFERVLGLLRGLSSAAPTVLVIEDVHWIDRGTRDLLTFLARNLTDERLAIVLTVRDDHLPPGHPILAWLAEIERSEAALTIEPARLDRAAVERQLRELAGGELTPLVAERIWRRSGGNPLFVEALCAARDDETATPRTIVEVLLARVAGLDPTARSVVDAAAVAGRPVDERLLADVLEIPETAVDAGVRAAHEHGVMELEPSTERHRFRHELLREVVEQQLLPGARRRLHERFARRLEARPELADTSPAGAAGELAVHFAAAGLADDAYRRSIDAATEAETVHAYADAHRHLERALDLEPYLSSGIPDDTARVDLRARAADDADLAGAFERALALTREALALVDADADPARAGMLHSRIGYHQWSLGSGTEALAAHEEAVRLVPADPPSIPRAKVLGALGGALMGEGRWAESRVLCEAAIECAIAVGSPSDESRARNMLGSDLVALGEVEAGIAQLREATRIAETSGRPDMRILGYHNLALNLAAADQLEEAVVQARAGLRVAREVGLERRSGPDLVAIAGDTLTRLGRLAEADAAVAEGLALDPRRRGTVYLSTVRARLAAIRGDFEEASARRAEIDLATLDPDVAAFVAAATAEALTWANRPAAAVAEAEAGLAHVETLDDVVWSAPLVSLGLRGVADLIESSPRGRGGPDTEAADRATRFAQRLEWMEPRASTANSRGWLALARGELARIAGEDGSDAWQRAIEAFDAIPEPLNAAYARLRAAEAALRAHGLRAEVAELLGAAASVAEAVDARPLLAAITALSSRARIPTARGVAPAAAGVADAGVPGSAAGASAAEPRAAAGGRVEPATAGVGGDAGGGDGQDPRAAAMALGLSAREVEVLELVTAGMTNGEIAERLFITRKTAAVHVTHILDKLGVANRVSAAMIGARVGLGVGADEDG